MTAVVSVGSNLGDRAAHLRAAVAMLGERFPLLAASAVYETAPVGRADQPPYLNAVLLLEADDPEALLAAAHDVENARGRLRSARWGPRTLDVDVVAVGQRMQSDPRLTIPHPRAHERAFVLVPWLDLDPDAVLPGHGPVRALVAGLAAKDPAAVRRWAG